MTLFGLHASHEQFAPGRLLALVRSAEAAGFAAAICSDHLLPWSGDHRGGVGHSFSWLGAAMAVTSLPFGVVCAPAPRHHPTTVAQAALTLEEMFPGRFWLAVGSGEALNEHVTGDPWPDKPVRDARLLEAVEVIRALWRGETVTHHGLVTVDRARVPTAAAGRPPLFAAAVSARTARWAGEWADGLVTINQPVEALRRVVEEFRERSGGKPVRLQLHLSWAPDEPTAERNAREQWRHGAFGPVLAWDLALPEQFDAASRHVPVEALRDAVVVSSDLGRHAELLAGYAAMGFDQVLLHNVGDNQEQFVAAFAEHVLPRAAS